MHIPVLLQSTIEGLALTKGETVVDATLGLGGHAKEILEQIGPTGTLIGFDQDGSTLAKAQENLKSYSARKIFRQENFRYLSKVLAEEGIERVDKFLFDLGFSSEQMDSSGRGFSFSKDEPLEMTLRDKITPETLTAEIIVNEWSEESLADIIYGYGEERYSRRIASAIVRGREIKQIKTTGQLVEIIKSALPVRYTQTTGPGRRKIHFATKTFQALRITVNDELGAIKEGLAIAWEKLTPDGRIAVISFHGLEARIVKNFVREKKILGELILINKKPITASREEIIANPRSRSAQLRIFKKIN